MAWFWACLTALRGAVRSRPPPTRRCVTVMNLLQVLVHRHGIDKPSVTRTVRDNFVLLNDDLDATAQHPCKLHPLQRYVLCTLSLHCPLSHVTEFLLQVGPDDEIVMLRPTLLAPGSYQPLPRPVAADVEGWKPKAHWCRLSMACSYCCSSLLVAHDNICLRCQALHTSACITAPQESA